MFNKILKFIILNLILAVFSFFEINAQQGVVTINQDRSIDRLLNIKKEINRSDLNYTIRAFRGNRTEAEKAHLQYRQSFSDWKTKLNYNYPRYEVWVGDFKTRLQADRELVNLKNKCGMVFKNDAELKKACRAAFVLKPKAESN